jgi:hypothetical protein
MITFEQLHTQNHKITELSNVLTPLMCERALCDNPITSELFFRYVASVKEHFELENKHLITELLVQKDKEAVNTAKDFLSGSAEIKRVFDKYIRKWCRNKKLRIGHHEQFLAETEDVFRLVLERLENETERLYPMVRRVREAA